MFHGQSPPHTLCLNIRDDSAPSGAGSQKPSGLLRIAYGRGETDPAGIRPGQSAQPLDQAHALPAAVSAKKRVDLIDHHIAKIPEQLRNFTVLVHQKRLQGLRRDLQDT